MSAPPIVPIASADGPFPSDRPTTFTDGYGRSQVLVPIEDLHRETAEVQRWRNDISAALGVRPGELNLTLAGAVEKIGDLRRDSEARSRERARATGRETEQLDRLAAECDRLAAERDAALAERVNLTGWLLTEIGDGNDAGATLIDLVRRYAEEECAVANALRDSWQRDADDAAILIERIKAGELAWDGSAWVEPVVDAVVIDHTDPAQIRRAAGVIEGIGMDEGDLCPDLRKISARYLRQRAALFEARS